MIMFNKHLVITDVYKKKLQMWAMFDVIIILNQDFLFKMRKFLIKFFSLTHLTTDIFKSTLSIVLIWLWYFTPVTVKSQPYGKVNMRLIFKVVKQVHKSFLPSLISVQCNCANVLLPELEPGIDVQEKQNKK